MEQVVKVRVATRRGYGYAWTEYADGSSNSVVRTGNGSHYEALGMLMMKLTGIDSTGIDLGTADAVPEWVVDQAESENPTDDGDLELTASEYWKFTPDIGEFGCLETGVEVEGHPCFDAIRFRILLGSDDAMEWVSGGTFYTNDEEPISANIRNRVMEIIIADMVDKLGAIDEDEEDEEDEDEEDEDEENEEDEDDNEDYGEDEEDAE